jgi:transcriptional regulator with XRE-family HTH domain
MAARATRPLRSVVPETAQSNVHLGSRLRELRHDAGWSIEAAAARAGLSANTLANLERAALPNPNLSTLLSLMEIYKLDSIEELLGWLPSRLLLGAWVARGRPGTRA